ncbi:3-deoxy-8-phosphooctulonate synthase [bacterium]|nr:3-deoxy-8-phosphooctulonate synthase [bacterium]
MPVFEVSHGVTLGERGKLFLIAGPCVIQDADLCVRIARRAKEIATSLGVSYVFKASFDKANRSSADAFRGPGVREGIRVLEHVKETVRCPVLTDVHEPGQCAEVAEVADILQIPAFLCRQTDLIVAAAKVADVVNVKKGQFLAPWDMKHPLEKCRKAGNARVILTERGASFGYNNLVSDMRSLPILRAMGVPVVFDATHSLQLPGGGGDRTSGQRQYIPHLARAAVATGVDGIFAEVHEDPKTSPSDAENMLSLDELEPLLRDLVAIKKIVP